MIILPTGSDPFYTFRCTLEGTEYLFTMKFNFALNSWSMTISDTAGSPIIKGVRVVTNRGLIARYRRAALPPGELLAITQGLNKSPAGLEELGEDKRVTLYYLTKQEISELP